MAGIGHLGRKRRSRRRLAAASDTKGCALVAHLLAAHGRAWPTLANWIRDSAPGTPFLKPPDGFEPSTCGLQNRCSDRASYGQAATCVSEAKALARRLRNATRNDRPNESSNLYTSRTSLGERSRTHLHCDVDTVDVLVVGRPAELPPSGH